MRIDSDSVNAGSRNIEKSHDLLVKALNNVITSSSSLDNRIRGRITGFSAVISSLNSVIVITKTAINKCNEFIIDTKNSVALIESLSASLAEKLSTEDILSMDNGPLNRDFLDNPEEYYQKLQEKKILNEQKEQIMAYGYNSKDADRIINNEIEPDELNQEIYQEYCNGDETRYKALVEASILNSLYFDSEELAQKEDKIKQSMKKMDEGKKASKKEQETYKKIMERAIHDSKKDVYVYIDDSGIHEFTKEEFNTLSDMYDGAKATEGSFEETSKLLEQELVEVEKEINSGKEEFPYKSINDVNARIKEINAMCEELNGDPSNKAEIEALKKEKEKLLEIEKQIDATIAHVLENAKYTGQPDYEENKVFDATTAREKTHFDNGGNVVINLFGIEDGKYTFMDSEEYRGALLARMLNGDATIGDTKALMERVPADDPFSYNVSYHDDAYYVMNDDGQEFYFYGPERQLVFGEYQTWINQSVGVEEGKPVVVTQQEIDNFNYICKTKGYKAGYEYFKSKEMEFDERSNAIIQGEDAANALNNRWLGAASIFTAIPDAIRNARNIAIRKGAGQKLHYSDSYSSSNTWYSTISEDMHKHSDVLGYVYDTLYSTDRLLFSAVITTSTGGGALPSLAVNTAMHGLPTFTNTVYNQKKNNIDDDNAIRFALICATARTLSTSYALSKATGLESTFNNPLNSGSITSKINSIVNGSKILSRAPEFSKNLLLTGYCMGTQGMVGGQTAVIDQTLTNVADILINGDMSAAQRKFSDYKKTHAGCSDFDAYMYTAGESMANAFSTYAQAFGPAAILGGIKADGIINHQKNFNQNVNFKEAFEDIITTPQEDFLSSGNTPSGGPNGGMHPGNTPSNDGGLSNKPSDVLNEANSTNSSDNSNNGKITLATPYGAREYNANNINELIDEYLNDLNAEDKLKVINRLLQDERVSNDLELRDQLASHYNEALGIPMPYIGVEESGANGYYEEHYEMAIGADGVAVQIPVSVWVPGDSNGNTTTMGSIQQTTINNISDTVGVKVPVESTINGKVVDSFTVINEKGVNNLTLPFAPKLSQDNNQSENISMSSWSKLTGAFTPKQLDDISTFEQIKKNIDNNGGKVSESEFNTLFNQSKLPLDMKDRLYKKFEQSGLIRIKNNEDSTLDLTIENDNSKDIAQDALSEDIKSNLKSFTARNVTRPDEIINGLKKIKNTTGGNNLETTVENPKLYGKVLGENENILLDPPEFDMSKNKRKENFDKPFESADLNFVKGAPYRYRTLNEQFGKDVVKEAIAQVKKDNGNINMSDLDAFLTYENDVKNIVWSKDAQNVSTPVKEIESGDIQGLATRYNTTNEVAQTIVDLKITDPYKAAALADTILKFNLKDNPNAVELSRIIYNNELNSNPNAAVLAETIMKFDLNDNPDAVEMSQFIVDNNLKDNPEAVKIYQTIMNSELKDNPNAVAIANMVSKYGISLDLASEVSSYNSNNFSLKQKDEKYVFNKLRQLYQVKIKAGEKLNIQEETERIMRTVGIDYDKAKYLLISCMGNNWGRNSSYYFDYNHFKEDFANSDQNYTKDELAVIMGYVQDPGINHFARGFEIRNGETHYKDGTITPEISQKEIIGITNDYYLKLYQALNKYSLPKDVIVFRGASIKSLDKYKITINDNEEEIKKKLAGKYEDGGFVSTSSVIEKGGNFLNNDVNFIIDLKAGTPCGELSKYSKEGECEVIIPPNVNFKVNDVKKIDGKILVYLTSIPTKLDNFKIDDRIPETDVKNESDSHAHAKLADIIEYIQLYQSKGEEISQIDKEIEDLRANSEYRKKVDELLKAFANEGIIPVSSKESIYDKPFSALLEDISTKIQNRTNTKLDYDENELIGYYNGLSDEEKNKYTSYEDFKKELLEDFQKEQDEENTKLNNLLAEFKKLEVFYKNMNHEIQELNNKRNKLLNERFSLLETELKNYDTNFLKNGIEYQNGFPVIKDNIDVVNKKLEFDEDNFSINDLVMVHATDYFPQGGIIKSDRDIIDSKRNTIHTALNGRVGNHSWGNWDNCGIVILDPLSEHIDQVACIYGVDTFTYGSMKLSDKATILIDSSKFEKIYEENKEYIDKNKDRIMLYSGNNLLVVENVLSMLGYVTQECGTKSWTDERAEAILNNFVREHYPNKLNVEHSLTPHKAVEKVLGRQAVLASHNIHDDGNDIIITPNVLYDLRKENMDLPLETFITEVGVFANDNEIHLLGIKDHINLLQSGKVSPFQVKKIKDILDKEEIRKRLEKEDNQQLIDNSEIDEIMKSTIGTEQLSNEQQKILRQQIARYMALSSQNGKINPIKVDSEGKFELQEGDLIHVSKVNNLDSIAQKGILNGQAVGIKEFMETYFCADFFRVPKNESLSTFTKNFKENYTKGLTSPYDMSKPIFGSFDIAFIVSPTEENKELLSYDPYTRKDNFSPENTATTKTFVNERGLLDGDGAASYAANGGYSSILYGVPSNQISTIMVGNGWAVRDVDKAIQEDLKIIDKEAVYDSYRELREKQIRRALNRRGEKAGIEDYTVDKFIDKLHSLFPNANIVAYNGTILYDASKELLEIDETKKMSDIPKEETVIETPNDDKNIQSIDVSSKLREKVDIDDDVKIDYNPSTDEVVISNKNGIVDSIKGTNLNNFASNVIQSLKEHDVLSRHSSIKKALKKGLYNISYLITPNPEKNIIETFKKMSLKYVLQNVFDKYTTDKGFDYGSFLNYMLLNNKLSIRDTEILNSLDDVQEIIRNPQENLLKISHVLDDISEKISEYGIEYLKDTQYDYLSFLVNMVARDTNFRVKYKDVLYDISEKLNDISTQLIESKTYKTSYKGVSIITYGEDTEFLSNALKKVTGLIDKLPEVLINQFRQLQALKIYDCASPMNLSYLLTNDTYLHDSSTNRFVSSACYSGVESAMSIFREGIEFRESRNILRILAHELGHAMDNYMITEKGTYFSNASSMWDNAIKKDNRSVSSYGDTKVIEDFAEMCMVYSDALLGNMDINELEEKYPARLEILKALFDLSLVTYTGNVYSIPYKRKVEILKLFDDQEEYNSDVIETLFGEEFISHCCNNSFAAKLVLVRHMIKNGVNKQFIQLFFSNRFLKNLNGDQVLQLYNLYDDKYKYNILSRIVDSGIDINVDAICKGLDDILSTHIYNNKYLDMNNRNNVSLLKEYARAKDKESILAYLDPSRNRLDLIKRYCPELYDEIFKIFFENIK